MYILTIRSSASSPPLAPRFKIFIINFRPHLISNYGHAETEADKLPFEPARRTISKCIMHVKELNKWFSNNKKFKF